MDILKAEIERKRKQLESQSLIQPKKKFFKREELIQKFDEEYHQKQAAKYGLKHPTGGDQTDGQQSSSQENQESSGGQNSGQTSNERILPRKEVIKRLRERNEPVILFGESETEAFRRLRKLELLEPETRDGGLRNDFQEAMEEVDAKYLEEIVKSSGDKNQKSGANDVKVEEMSTTIEEILQLAQHFGRRRDEAGDSNVIHTFLKFLLELWGKKLNSRPEKEKTSTQGKIQSAIYTQTQTYLRPLLKQLKSNKVAEDILKHLIIITRHMLERNYIKANDAYLQMAIGNAPWPIGVTMVGIHARTGREKIFSQNIAHVLNDETQRKYIQALKRLMTQCQKLFTTDPSRCVEYTKA